MTIPSMDRLDPIQRLEFDKKAIRTWRVTWPDGTTELVRGHALHSCDEGRAVAFHYDFLGAHRFINLAHVRDIAEVDDQVDR